MRFPVDKVVPPCYSSNIARGDTNKNENDRNREIRKMKINTDKQALKARLKSLSAVSVGAVIIQEIVRKYPDGVTCHSGFYNVYALSFDAADNVIETLKAERLRMSEAVDFAVDLALELNEIEICGSCSEPQMCAATADALDVVPEQWLINNFPDFNYSEKAAQVALYAFKVAA